MLRTIPLKILPMNFFGRHTPYASIILWVGSPSSGKLSFCFFLKFARAFSGSALTPRIATFSLSKLFFASRNSDASVVQPGVLAFGKKKSTTLFPRKSLRETRSPVSLFNVKSGALSAIFSIFCALNRPAAFLVFHSLLRVRLASRGLDDLPDKKFEDAFVTGFEFGDILRILFNDFARDLLN